MTAASPRFRRQFLTTACILAILAGIVSPRHIARAQVAATHRLTWDSHSLILDGKRLLLYSGEFHYWRLPSRSQWLDRLEKMKAAGLNAVSIYFDWQYHSSAPDQFDYSGIRDVDYLLRLTDQLGLYVIARVGPYMNAEADAGGLPGWLLTKPLFPRSQAWNGSNATPQYSPLYSQYSKEWYGHLLPILARHQVTTGGSVILLCIENEYSESQGSKQYMQDLYNDARGDGITVPIFHNDYWFQGNWSNLVELYAYDSYPYGFDCCHQWWDLHFHGVDSWEATLRNTLHISTPMFVAELQGGAFDPWGGKGYQAISQTLDGDWLNALDQSALAQGTDILNTYMFVGGTTWGYMSEPGVYTSYDYGAPISEAGELRPAYYSAHRLGMFLQTYGSVLAGADAAPTDAVASNPQIVVHTRVDSQSGQTFIFLRHGDAGPSVSTRLRLTLGQHDYQIPQAAGTSITIPGHGALLLTANDNVGPLHMNYSTSQVLTDADTAAGHYLVLFGPEGTQGETDFALPAGPVTVTHNLDVQVNQKNGELRLNYRHTADPRTIAVQTSSGVLRIIVTSDTEASRYWLADGRLIAGPDLVTGSGQDLKIWTSTQRDVTVYGSQAVGTLSIDGRETAQPDAYMGSTLLGNVAGAPTIQLPQLGPWKFAPASPETDPGFDDSQWIVANHPATTNPNVPSSSTLLADDYGFHYGFVWYRGHFTPSGAETGITLEARQSYSVYLNGAYLGGADESLADPPHAYASARTFAFPAGMLRPGQDNVIAVLTESLGHDEGWLAGPLAQSPQGIISAQVAGATTPVEWRLQGDAGGEHPADGVRGIFNASGLYGERNGWYLPNFDDAAWQTVTVPDNWTARGAAATTVGWYRTHFTLNLPANTDMPIGLTFPHVSDKAVIWVNGWLLGRYWEQMGPQHTFYLPQGILNPDGDNVLSIAVWNRGGVGGLTAEPFLQPYAALAGQSLKPAGDPLGSVHDYWHTRGNLIVDSAGRPVRIAAINWTGMQNIHYVPEGLDRQPLDAIVAHIRAMGFNTIRLPFSNQMVESNPVIKSDVGANPDVKGLHALQIMDRIVQTARKFGLRVILEDHRSSVGADPELNGLWYTRRFPETSWIHDWQVLVRRYLGDDAVVGVDLRDEPHTGPPGPWSINTYLHQGVTWGPYHGIENWKTDWRLAAERGGDAVLRINPHLLIFVEGVQQYPDPTQPGGLDSYWWGGILGPVLKYPVRLSIPHQLVYSPHEYGPNKYNMAFFGPKMSYRSMVAIWEKHWSFLLRSRTGVTAPIFIGEFGTCGQTTKCVEDTSPGSQGLWFSYFMRFLREDPEIGWSFWALNGSSPGGAPQPDYILRLDWHTVRLHQLLDDLRDVEVAPPPAA